MEHLSDFAGRFNQFLYRQQMRRLGKKEVDLARGWCLNIIRREYPHLSEEQRERFYENLIHVQVTAVDEWTRRMT
jgi:hypothetical protein